MAVPQVQAASRFHQSAQIVWTILRLDLIVETAASIITELSGVVNDPNIDAKPPEVLW